MSNEELSREIERAARNRKKLAALAAENERAAKDVATALGTTALGPAALGTAALGSSAIFGLRPRGVRLLCA